VSRRLEREWREHTTEPIAFKLLLTSDGYFIFGTITTQDSNVKAILLFSCNATRVIITLYNIIHIIL